MQQQFKFLDFFIPSIRRKKASIIGLTITSILSVCYIFLEHPDDCGDFCTMTLIQIIFAGVNF